MKRYTSIKNNLLRLLCTALIAVFVLPCISVCETHADYVTDTLSVKVGYSGMELSEYVELGKWYWYELEEMLPMHTVSYSYFQGNGTTDENYVYNDSSYTSIVATGYGFYVTDLLEYVNVYNGDIYNVLFYVNDHNTIWTALDNYSLFRQRYYFEDLPGHRETLYNVDYTVKTGYDFSRAWDAAYEVQPMLALECNWDSVNQEAENHPATEVGMSTSTRFHLLYGQLSPTERITKESAKYVSCVYITLNGKAEYGEMPDLDKTLGSHTVDVQVSADNESIRNALSELMNINSTNENVLKITGYTITPSDIYSDLATITISYDIISEGDATITAQVGSSGDATVVADTTKKPSNTDSKDNENQGGADDGGTGKDATDGQGESGKDGADSTGGVGSTENTDNQTVEPSTITENEKIETTDAVEINADEISTIFQLADNVTSNLNELFDASVSVPADTSVEKVLVEDNSEEKKAEQIRLLIFTGLGALLVCLIGAAASLLTFRFRLHHEWTKVAASLREKIGTFFFGKI